jgi:hypothetical protein
LLADTRGQFVYQTSFQFNLTVLSFVFFMVVVLTVPERSPGEQAVASPLFFAVAPDGHPNSSTCGHLKLLHPERGLTMG